MENLYRRAVITTMASRIGRTLLILPTLLFAPLPAAAAGETITLVAAGDLMMGRHIGKEMKRKGEIYPFMNFITPFRGADIVFANLESILGDETSPLHFPDKPYNFIAPTERALLLKRLGFNVLNLANNHAMDYGPTPIARTRKALARQGIAHFGAGKDLGEAAAPAIMDVKGVSFGFLGFTIGHSPRVYADEKRGGAAPLDPPRIIEEIAHLREKVDVVILSLHWGIEYEKHPTERQRRQARSFIDAGADLILGHHPHVMQGVEFYKGGVIAYSLGNFLFDQRHDDTGRSFMLLCRFRGERLQSTEIIPLDRFNAFYPRPAPGEKKRAILNHLAEISAPLNDNPLPWDRLGEGRFLAEVYY